MSRDIEEKGFHEGDWEGVSRKLVSSKAVPEGLNLKCRSKFNQGFTNRGCLHWAILNVLHGFKEKKSQEGKRFYFQFYFSKCLKLDF